MSTERIDLGERLSSLSPEALEALLRSLAQEDGSTAIKDKAPTHHLPEGDAGEGIFPATYAQILFWRQYDADRGGSNNHQSMAFRIRGGLDVEALKSSFQILSDSQPSLRTVYFEDDRDIWQHIIPSLPIPFEVIVSDAKPEKEEFLKRPFDLESEPPIRVRLVREDVNVNLLQIVLHHIASDGRSKVVLLQRLSEIYNALIGGDATEARIHDWHLGRKAMAERTWLSDPASEETKRYWQASFFSKGMGHPWPGGRHWVSALNTDPYVSDRLDLDLGVDLSQRLRLYAAEREMTPLQVMMGCYCLCLQRLGSGGAVTFGMPVDMRNREEDASIVGCFMNVVPVTMDAESPGSIDDYLALAAERMRSAVEHARMPLYSILEFGFSDGHSARTMSWRAIVNFKEDHADALFFSGASIECLPYIQLGTSGDIALTLNRARGKDGQHSITFSADIDVSKISLADASALLETWRSVMIQCVSRQITLVSDIDILLPGEKEHIRECSGRDHVVVIPDTTLHQIFRTTVQAHPNRPAVIEADGRETSYVELQGQVYKVAAFLRANGLEMEDVVAVHMQRSSNLLASILGILEAGGAFLLLEPSLPVDRLRTMAEGARAKWIITSEGMEILPGFEKKSCVYSEMLSAAFDVPSIAGSLSEPGALAYVMFTSGSTGVPKGAMVEHRNIVNRLSYTRDAMRFGSTDRTLQKSPLSFDVCLTELLLPMFTSGAVVMADAGSEVDVQRIADLVALHRATYLHFVPGVLKAFLQVPDIKKVNGILRMIRCGGESLPDPVMNECLDTLDARLYQSYGPAETAVAVTLWESHRNHGHPKPPIGKPNANVDILIMDPLGRPVPSGMSGEIWIGGAQTGRGYINNKQETKYRFVADPLEPGSDRRYYRTGDLARFLSDGNILFLGRMDDQLKVRGIRIELGDVSATLLRCEGVREAVVLAEPDGDGSNRLRAWVTLKEGSGGHESRIRAAMTELLPGYMVPFRIHIIGSIPLTPHGKTDNRALRAIAEQQGEGDEGLALATLTERRLAALWSELLGTDVRHRDADFFRLGGHSLIAMRLAGRLQKELGVTVRLTDFYTDARLDRLAALIDDKPKNDREVPHLSDMPARLPGERVPMSWAQRRMWMLQHMLAAPSAYHIALVFPIPRACTSLQVKSMLQSIATRHGILRTLLSQDHEGFWQEEMHVSDWRIDWAELDASSQEECVSILSEARVQVFDLSMSPGWRASWVRQQSGEDLLLLVFHHALFDEWSMGLFRKEFLALLSGQASSPMPEKPAHSYIDFSRWQHWTFSRGLRERLEAYWRGRLSDLGEPVRLAYDLKASDGASGSCATVTRHINRSLRQSMDAYCKREGLSRFAVWMTIWQILQSRLGSGEEVMLATPVSERDRPEWQDLMGMCLNTLPIRTKVDEKNSFRSFSRTNHRSLAGDLEHGQLPYEDIVRLVDSDIGTEGYGLPQVMFAWHGEYEWTEEDGAASAFSRKRSHAKNPVSIHITDRPEGCRMSIHYDDALFLEQTMEKILQRYEAVAMQALDNPDIRISDIDILLPGEFERLREYAGRDHMVSYPQSTLHEIFCQTAARYPDHPAVIMADGMETSYADLQSQISIVSSFLRSNGIKREAVIAIHLQRSPSLMATMYGILEAGGAVLLLEPSLPLDRLRMMAEQARVAAVITEDGMPLIPGFSEQTHIYRDILSGTISEEVLPQTNTSSESLACVIFTSGSTGVPKGSMLEHRNLVNYLYDVQSSFAFQGGVRTLQKTLLTFDLSLTELFLPCLSGGAVVFTELDREMDMARNTALIEANRVTYVFFAPAQLKLFLETPDVKRTEGVLQVIACGGESLPEPTMSKCLETLATALFHIYGPAEAAVWVSIWPCHVEARHPKPPIGRPNANVDILIMDTHGRLVPQGMPGELWIGGAQTGRGYINNKEETKYRFVADPLEPGSDRRYYRTGDLARFLPDGNILFLGRLDDQLKVRGIRIELGDVSAAMLRCEGVREAVVLAEPDGDGSNRLRAWVTLKEGSGGNESGIRAAMSELLPGYMVPFRIHIIGSIPLTPHGKTDNRALRAIAEQQGEGDEGLPLTTPTERRLAALWSELLGVEVKHRDADFFRLGGHSLIAIRLAGRMHKEFGVAVSLPDFYTDSRLESLATSIDARVGEGDGVMHLSDMPALVSGERVPMSWAQRRMWMLQFMLAQPSSYHIASTLPIPSGRNASETKGILQMMAERHGILRTRLWQEDEGFWQEEIPVEDWSMDWDELDAGSSEECISIMSDERDRHFDLSTNPGWRARWVTQAGKTPCLLLVFHHALTDEWSMNLFIKELEAHMSDKVSASEWQKPAYRYIDFARWQHWTFSEGLRERLEAYWKQRLSALGEPVRIIPDHTLTNGTPGSSGMISGPFDRATYALMDTYCKKAGLSRFAVWMAVWQVLQARLGTGEEVVIATPVSERGASEWEDVLGMFLNTLPIRTKIDERATFRAYSRQNHRQLAQDLKYGQLPYEDILRVTDIDLGPDSSGLPQVMFVLHGDREWLEEESDQADINPKQKYANGQLSIHIKEYDGGCRTLLTYDADRFRAETAESILRRFEKVTRQVLADPDIIIADIDILLPGERERIIELSGRANIVDHPRTTLHEVFRQTANRYSDRPAVIEANGSETNYAELQDQVFKVAAFLKARGIGNGMVVAVHMHRSPALLATILGVSEAGGAFLLLEQSLPLPRLRTMVEESRAAAVITESDLPILPGFEQRSFVFDEIPSVTFEDAIHGVSELDPHALAYVIFTSGSTGVPKGAMVEQMNMISYFYSIRDAYAFGPGHRTLLRTPLSFDACLIELILPLFSGGAVVMSDEGAENDMQIITELMADRGISHLFCVPSILGVLLDEPGLSKAKGILQMIISGGESFQDSLMRACQDALDVDIFQDYGPTETTVAVTCWKYIPGHGHPKPPIGKPNSNVDVLIMDIQGRPVPPGMTGELWIGGAQTGRGYINNEEETINRFVGDPIEPDSGRKYYRSGDLARFLPDGNILFLGRMDDQLKVRGVRIELGDVSTALLRCEGVREAAVLPEPDGEGSNRLRAWVTIKEGFEGNESDIRSAMNELLPSYMVPFRIHVIDSIPLTQNGKTDHRALRALADVAGDVDEGLPLITDTEFRLAALWAELLSVEVRHREVDFFRLGGHSLAAMRLAGRIQKAFGVKVSLSDFYTDGRLCRLAARIDTDRGLGDGDVRLSDMPALLPGERVPMSWSQRRMWMLQQLLANPSSYHISLVFRIPAGRSALEACGFLHSMAAHHGILRTRLFQEDDSFWQQELPMSEWTLNWRELEADSPEECIRLMSEEQEYAFDLTTEPGWRARWVRENTGDAYLLLIFHHALVDEWSMNLFRNEFEALLTGKTSAEKLIKPAYSYIDFSRWQHWTFAQGLRIRLEAYWRERLSNLGEPVRLTTDLVPNNAAPGRNATVTIPVDASLRKQMEDYCKREGLSRFAVWMAVWQILHSRLGNGEEVVLATPVSERDMLEWQDVMGMCLNTLPIRAKVDVQASFRSFSRSCHSQLAQDLANDQFPYEDIVRLADGDLGTDGQGLPQVMFAWHGEYEWSEEDGLASGFPRKGSLAKNLISIHITDRREACRISIHYDDGLFLEQKTLKILQRYEAVARQVMEQPDMCISDIDILLPGEREYLRELSGRDHMIVHPETTLHSIFRKTVERYPDRPAVIDADGRETSYAELKGQATKVAAFLRSTGIEREAIVAVYMQRSSKLLASMLGVLEAGGAFMLMEPGLPLDRLHRMADQARIAALVTDKAMPVIPEYSERTHLFDDILNAPLTEEHEIEAFTDPTSLACVIFTSGSTGVPKGAMLEHGNLLNYLGEIKDTYSFGSEDRTLQKTLLSFDASLIELMLPMISGGSVVMPEPGVEADMRRLAGIAELHRVSYVFFAPAQLRLFLEIPGIEKLNRSLRVIACGGESVPDSLVTMHLETLKASLYQIYGPTETSIAVAQWNCRSGHGQPKPPLGRPNANVDILIMDDHGRPVPPGMPGELWIGGAQTGRGYINNEEETKKRFVTDPLETGSDRRYYRTGDLARFLPDGNILFLGRMDDQLKVRGVRIELGDVTAALLRCHGVREAIVLAEPDGEGSNRLRAWVTVEEDVEVNESLIRSSMADLLPGYMVPFRIHVIDSIPLTPHGKTDNRALRKMAENGGEETEGLPLISPTEHRLAMIWSELLGTDVQHRDADFFRLGGHSLVVIRLLDTIKSSWGVRPDISAVFMNSSLESMAHSIDTSTKTLRSKGLDVVITPEKVWDTGKGRHVFAFVGGAGSEEEFTKYHLIGRALGEDWRIHILPDPETSKGRFPTIGLDRLAEMYAKAMIPCCRDESVWLMGDCIGGLDAFAVAINLQSAGVVKPGLILMDSPVPGNVKSREVNQSEGLELYRDLPERASPVREALFRSFLWLARFKPLRSLFHMRPRSRGQVLTMAMAYRLFDPADYSLRCPESGRTSEETFHHYLTIGRLKGEPPSDRFNGYRYAKHVDGFDLQGDDPVLHALLVGFREGYPRSRVLAYVESPNMKSDLMSARREIRRSFDVPVKYEGQVHMIVIGNVRKDERRPEWQKYVAGMVHVHHVEGDHRSYLKEKLVDTAKTIGRILAGTG